MAVLPFTKTDIYEFLEASGAGITRRMSKIVSDPNCTEILNEKLNETLVRFTKTFNTPIAAKAAIAVRNGHIVLFNVTKPEQNLPEAVPFFRYTKGGQAKVGVNVTGLVHTSEGPEGKYYDIEDMRKFYAVLVAAFINLTIPDPGNYPVKVMEMGAIMWAKVFCRILNSIIGLATSRDRYACFYYYAIRFYLAYFIGAPQPTIDSIANATVKEREGNGFIAAVEEYLAKDPKNVADFYGSFTGFCNAMFNNEITNTKSMRLSMADPNAKLNVSFYVRKFVDSYYQSAIMALANAHYFTWVMLCVQMKAYMVNIKMLGSVVDVSKLLDKYFAALYTEAESAAAKYI